MKKFNLSLAAFLAMGTFAMAGGDIAPVEPVIETPVAVEEPSTGAFYVGLGYSYMNMNIDGYTYTYTPFTGTVNAVPAPVSVSVPEEDHDGDAVLLLAGYNFNEYVGVEARYAGFTDCLENAGIYVKPQYPIGAVTVYGLLGYGETSYDNGTVDLSEDGFQWGIGADYAINEKVAVFVDYTNLYDDSGFDGHLTGVDHMVDSINVGVTYTF
ncbi:MAG TPA: porin [Sulfurovum sp.]|uniref:porin n=1 Tax=Sulfurovum sp. TaxID=1969726 RepID=UPI002F93F603